MLIRYSVENFLSFRQRVEMSMIPGKGTLKKHHLSEPVNGVKTLKTSIVLGANASGKSNLIKAIDFGRNFIVRGYPVGQHLDYQCFRLNVADASRESRMEFEIQTAGKNYAYGFVFNHKGVVEEWLYELTNRKEKAIFERDTKSEQIFKMDYLLELNPSKEHQQYISFTAKGTPENQLFLREMVVRNVAANTENIEDVQHVYNWFLNALKVVFPDDKYKHGLESEIMDDDKLKKMYEDFLKYFGTGIAGISMVDEKLENLNLPENILSSIKEKVLSQKSEGVRVVINFNGNSYFFSFEKGELHVRRLKTKHQVKGGDYAYFDTVDESDGTNRIIDLIPLLIDLIEGENVFVIDEMERSLHPNLIYDIIDLFLDEDTHSKGQLILATHESSLITQNLFRKDEIWFVVKNEEGASHLHSLEDYKVRFDKDIRKDYLLGRFKAVPRIGSRDDLNINNNDSRRYL